MHGPTTNRISRFRASLLVAFSAVIGAGLLWNSLSQADDPASIVKTRASFSSNDNLNVAVWLTNDAKKTVAGSLQVDLISTNGKIIATGKQEVKEDASNALVGLKLKVDRANAEKLTLRTTFAGKSQSSPLSEVLFAKGHETTLSTSQKFVVGSPAVLQCKIEGIQTLSKTEPLPDAEVIVNLRDENNKVQSLYKGKTNSEGERFAHMRIPEVKEGTYTLEITTRSPLGEETLKQQVRIESDAKILLVTDKPMYQPGQEMHIRALVLRPFDLKPVANTELQFEIEDGKGNKVFKKSITTSAFGIANVDFQLADEVNMGNYQIRAGYDRYQSNKTVAVKRYVLPKFKIDVTADKKFYMPKETIRGSVQTDYFFGKPVANSKVKITASTFDVEFRKFQSWEGETDANGHVKFEIKLPDYFVGQPLQKGNGLVKLDVEVKDTADQKQSIVKNFTVSEQPIQISLIPEGGKLVPEMENRIFAAAVYPDGTPAEANVKLWLGKEAKGNALATVKTSPSGLAEFKFTPKKGDLRQGNFGQQKMEFLGGQQIAWLPEIVVDLYAEARDGKGNVAKVANTVNTQPTGDNVLLRLNQAIYKAGDAMQMDIRSSAGLPTVYVDVIRGGQTLLTRALDLEKGQAEYKLDLPQEVFGSMEVHAYQMLYTGEIIRDSRVVYVEPRNDLKVSVEASKKVFAPGERGRIQFVVTDKNGNPTQAALGVIIVDEAVYALQEMQPGLEKVYFTLQEELLKPRVQAKLPVDNIGPIVGQPVIAEGQQQIAAALLTAVDVQPPQRWQVAPALQRKQQFQQTVQQVAWALWNATWQGKDVISVDKKTGKSVFSDDALDVLVKNRFIGGDNLKGPFGEPLTINDLSRLEKEFKAENLAEAVTLQRLQNVTWWIVNIANENRNQYFKNNEWTIPKSILNEAVKRFGRNNNQLTKDIWGRPFHLLERAKDEAHPTNQPQLGKYTVVSAGADGKLGTKDDIRWTQQNLYRNHSMWWTQDQGIQLGFGRNQNGQNLMFFQRNNRFGQAGGFGGGGFRGGIGGGGEIDMMARDGAMPPMAAPGGAVAEAAQANAGGMPQQEQKSGGAAPPRIREYFPETMLWQPALITDESGVANLAVNFADSITTWRMSASASSQGGALGGATIPLKVFQDFFVDIDLPVNLTQDDEVAFPVAVYNYLDTPQTVKIELKQGDWFTLVDTEGLTRNLKLGANEVTSIQFRIKANRVGNQPLTVMAYGSKKSDAVRRVIEIVPNGEKQETAVNDRLADTVKQTVVIPEDAIDDSYKLFVKIQPGVMAAIVEGLEGMMRMPGGCFEQTSSSAYPNILIVDYIKQANLNTPEVRMKAENYLNVGYQRLLTFERPGGGFDWWGSGEPLIWLSAYGLQEFHDMSRVWPIDRGIIDRTQGFLMRKMNQEEGTWSTIGDTHGETIASMGNPKLLLTSYVTWSLLESGLPKNQLTKSIDYIRNHVNEAGDNAYIMALAANALAAYDAKDDSTLAVLQKLETMKKAMPQWDACCYPTEAPSLTYARGDSVTVETTALTVLAMLKTGQFNNSINKSLTYLIKSKNSGGSWGSTSATILSLKALVGGMGGAKHQGVTPFTISVNGKEVVNGQVTEDNYDITQVFDLQKHTQRGKNELQIKVKGETSMTYQIVGRSYVPWKQQQEPTVKDGPMFDIKVAYDRAKLATNDMLKAKATLTYNGKVETNMVMVELGIAPGFTVDAGEFAEMVASKDVQKFSVTPTKVTLYLGKVMRPGETRNFEYTLKAKFPVRAQTPPTVAYEYYTPTNRGVSAPVQLTVTDRK